MGTVRKGTLALVVLLGVAVSVLGWLIGFSILSSVLPARDAAQPVPAEVTPVPTVTPPAVTEAPPSPTDAPPSPTDAPFERPGADATGPEECTSVEVYHAETQQCLLDCDTEEECERLVAQLEAELDEYFQDSQTDFPPGETDLEEPARDGEQPTGETSGDDGTESGRSAENNSVLYDVQPDLSLSPAPEPEHQKLWEMFVTVVSKEVAAERIVAFRVYEDYENDYAAAVWEAAGDGKWFVEFNLTETGDTRELIHTMIHEYGHIVTLNDTQVEGSISDACPRFRYQNGCAKPESYMNAFYEKFWKKYGADAVDEENPVDLYETQPADTFVSNYAATNMLEDMAETWAVFVLREKPTGNTEADAKVRFFYDYPELVKERDRIRAAISRYVR